MLISLIVAMDRNRLIGTAGQLPWHLPGELQRFKRLTMGQTLLMGRKTYESIGQPLPGRQLIVLSRNPAFQAEGCIIANSLPDGIAAATTSELFICGGGEIYQQALPLAERIYLSKLQGEFTGDTYFPDIPPKQFKTVTSEWFSEAQQSYQFSILQRIA